MRTSDDALTDLDLEKQVLGTLIRSGEKGKRDLVFEVDAILRTEEVFTGVNRAIYRAITAIAKAGSPPTRNLVPDFAATASEKVDPEYVRFIAENVVTANRDAFLLIVERVAELYRSRLVRSILVHAVADVGHGENVEGVVKEVSTQLLRAIEHQRGSGGTIGEILDQWERRRKEVLNDPVSDWHVQWGLWSIDNEIGRLIRGGHFVAVGAHTKAGKTVIATDLVRANGLHGDLHPLMIELEMTEEDALERILSAEGEIPYRQVRDNAIDPHFFAALEATKELIRKRTDNAWLEHIPGGQLRDIIARIRAHVAQYQTRLVIVDYVQIIDMPRGHSRQTEVADAVRTLKRLATELKITIVGMCQLNDEINKRSNNLRRPLSSDTREAKDIEKDADVVVLIDRPLHRHDATFWDGVPAKKPWFFSGAPKPTDIEIARIDFNRTRRGAEFYKPVWWQGQYQRFAELPVGFDLPTSLYNDDGDVF